ncbi:MAG: hypothetical protein KGI37_07430 [Alphaproteobacteria bacterium]|nr:hypothetical protein [Alphaproteobacteria bacterium]
MDRLQIRAPGQLSWLNAVLAARRGGLSALLLRLKDIGMRMGANTVLHKKFMALLDQVAIEREKELDILNDIEEVEKFHAQQRRNKLLRQAANDDKPRPRAASLKMEQPEEKPARGGLLKWVLLFGLLAQRPRHDKNQ